MRMEGSDEQGRTDGEGLDIDLSPAHSLREREREGWQGALLSGRLFEQRVEGEKEKGCTRQPVPDGYFGVFTIHT